MQPSDSQGEDVRDEKMDDVSRDDFTIASPRGQLKIHTQ
jgi:hypothetical protein